MISEFQSTEPPTYFEVILIVPMSNTGRIHYAQVVEQEFWKIGIKTELILASWDVLIPRTFVNVGFTTYENGGFDISFIPSKSDLLTPGDLWKLYHSTNINKTFDYIGTPFWVHRDVDGVQGLTQEENSFFVLPMIANWTSCWSGGKIERDDNERFTVLFELVQEEEGTDATYRIEYDKSDGTLAGSN